MKTKWDLISEEEREMLDRTPIPDRVDGTVMRCTGCGIRLTTEGDFARHFVVPDHRYPNLGNCPNRVLDEVLETRHALTMEQEADMYGGPPHGEDQPYVDMMEGGGAETKDDYLEAARYYHEED